MRIDASNVAQYFNGALQNIGVQNNLVDTDLDCREALIVADTFLPITKAIFGRKSKPRSHRLYYSNLADTSDKAAIQFRDPHKKEDVLKAGHSVMLLELRCGGGGKGAQTVFPGSVHEEGEPIEWAQDEEPAFVDGEVLRKAASEAACACLLARYWPPVGSRHFAAQALGGFLARAGMDVERVAAFTEAMTKAIAGKVNRKETIRIAKDAATAYEEGKNAYGLPQLAKEFDAETAKACAEWLGHGEEEDAPEGHRPNKGRVFSDLKEALALSHPLIPN